MSLSVDIVNQKGEKVEALPLPEGVFGVKPNSRLVHEVVTAYLANTRRGTHSTKTKGEVSGGGAKPWKQKGTGNARSGSIRSPLWRHGGVTFGPKPHRGYLQPISQQKRRLALKTALSDYLKNGKVRVISEFVVDEPKTRKAAEAVKAWGLPARAVLIVDRLDPVMEKATRNIAGLKIVEAKNLNSYGVLLAGQLLFTKAGLERLLKRLEGEGEKTSPSAN